MEFLVLDTETTGLDPKKDQLISFGAIRIKNRKIQVSESLELRLKQDFPIGPAIRIHGILSAGQALSQEEFAEKTLSILGNSILVGHHIQFDLEILLQVYRPFGLGHVPNPVLDTLSLCMRLDHGPLADYSRIKAEDYSLDSLCQRFGIETDDRHTASGDAFLTAQLLQKLLILAEKKGIDTFSKLIR
ncbi:3'-5' exonuclease [Algoriphagus confluentis]